MAKPDKDSTDLVEKANTAVSTDVDFDFGSDAGAGMEGVDAQSFAIPFLSILHKQSPQCEETDPKFIEGAKQGQFFNSVNNKLYDGKEGILFLQSSFQRRFLRWGPRGTPNSGFKGEFLPEIAMQLKDEGLVVEQDGKLFYPLEGGVIDDKRCDRLVDTRNHFGILYDQNNGTYGQVLMSLSSTQIKKSKQIISMLSEIKIKTPKGLVTPPTWFTFLHLTTVPESNDRGTWAGLKPAIGGNLQDRTKVDAVLANELYLAAKAFHEALVSGTAGPINYAEPEETAQGEGF